MGLSCPVYCTTQPTDDELAWSGLGLGFDMEMWLSYCLCFRHVTCSRSRWSFSLLGVVILLYFGLARMCFFLRPVDRGVLFFCYLCIVVTSFIFFSAYFLH